MNHFDPPTFLKILGHGLRWQLLKALSNSDLKVQELVQAVNQPQNLVSYHLRLLESNGIVREHQSIADGREIYYSLDLQRISGLFHSVGVALHPVLGISKTGNQFLDPIALRILFLCTHNSARSQMAEAIFRNRTGGNIEVQSAGTEPGEIHPLTIHVMNEMGIDLSSQQSKDLKDFLGQKFDFVVTVCDRAKEVCPVFPGDPVRIHWSIPDPVSLTGGGDEQITAFRETAQDISQRVGFLIQWLYVQSELGIQQ